MTMLFVNLPVNDLEASKTFYEALGYSINPQFTDETAACVVISESIYAMILTHSKFAQYTPLPIADARASTQVLNALSCESRDEVDAKVNAAVGAGGNTYSEPVDLGFMYQWGFQDPDGHMWEVFYMNMAEFEQAGN